MTWGYALVWAGQFLKRDPDPLMAKLKFLAHYGLTTTGVGLGELEVLPPARLDAMRGYLADHGLALHLVVGAGWLNPDRAAMRLDTDAMLAKLERFAPLVRCPLVSTGGGPVHRFTREPSLAGQMDMLAEALAPVAARCHDLGLPLGVRFAAKLNDQFCDMLLA